MEFLNLIFHVNEYLASVIAMFGAWIYVLLFAVIFAETGLVVMPFLPGDSLLFAVGALAGAGLLNVWVAYIVMLAAAIIGDTVNYWIGHHIGPRVFSKENSRFFNKAYLEKTREFYEKHGGKTIIFARFFPILRTFAPFVAGIGKMHYRTFLFYNITGAFAWVTFFTFIGYFFGGLSFIKDNFEYAVLGIIALSLVPMFIEYIKYRRGPRISAKQLESANYEAIRDTFEK